MMRVPYDLITEILCRVPVKYLLRCRCVSKNWCSLVDSTYFVKKHYETSLKYNSGGIIIRSLGGYSLANYESFHDDVCNAIEINDPEFKSFSAGTKLVGSANGLVCLSTKCVDVIVLLNPSTRKCTKLPIEPAELSQSFYELYKIDKYLCGFGYDQLSDDYKVVKVAVRRDQFYYEFMVLVYSLKINSWTRLQNVRLSSDICFEEQCGTFASGALYWPIVCEKKVDSCLIIVRFDLGLEQFTEVVDSVPNRDYINTDRLVAFGGSLHILDYNSVDYYNCRIDVSQLNDFGMRNSRFKVFSVNGGRIEVFGLKPLAYSKSGQEVLVHAYCSHLMWYHLQSEAFRKVHDISYSFGSHSYTESLFQFTQG